MHTTRQKADGKSGVSKTLFEDLHVCQGRERCADKDDAREGGKRPAFVLLPSLKV